MKVSTRDDGNVISIMASEISIKVNTNESKGDKITINFSPEGFLSSGNEKFNEDSRHLWVVSGSKRKKKTKKKGSVMISIRTNSRIPKDGRTEMEKVIQKAQANDEGAKGNSFSNQFLILNNLDNDHICNRTDQFTLD